MSKAEVTDAENTYDCACSVVAIIRPSSLTGSFPAAMSAVLGRRLAISSGMFPTLIKTTPFGVLHSRRFVNKFNWDIGRTGAPAH
jgi:hypothetical protein